MLSTVDREIVKLPAIPVIQLDLKGDSGGNLQAIGAELQILGLQLERLGPHPAAIGRYLFTISGPRGSRSLDRWVLRTADESHNEEEG